MFKNDPAPDHRRRSGGNAGPDTSADPDFCEIPRRFPSTSEETLSKKSSSTVKTVTSAPPPAPGPVRASVSIGMLSLILIAMSMLFLLVFVFGIYSTHALTRAQTQQALAVELKEKRENNASLVTDRVEAEALALTPWIVEAEPAYVASRKLKAISIDAGAIDHANLGLYEQYALRRAPEAALHYLFASTRGERRSSVILLQERKHLGAEQQKTFEAVHQLNGGEGYLALGQYYLYGEIITQEPVQGHPEVMETTLADTALPVFATDPAKAFRYFHIATLCNVPNAYQWRNEITMRKYITEANQSAEREAGEKELADLVSRAGTRREAFCSGTHLEDRLSRLQPHMLLTDTGILSLDQLVATIWLPVADFDRFIASHPAPASTKQGGRPGGSFGSGEDMRGYGAEGLSADGSKFYRDSPGGGVPRTEMTYDGLPPECRGANAPADCSDRLAALTCSDEARYNYNLGEAEMARGALDAARAYFTQAITVGRTCGSEYAVMSSKRLGALNLTCEYTPDSLRRIARGAENNPEGGDIIDLIIRQRALRALGHYRDDVDGRYGPNTRAAITSFQREFGFRETGDLTPIETVYLICGAAEIARDVDAYTTLGLMYVTGLGTVQNTDLGLQWLKLAARDGDDDALYNLALLYGSGTVLSSYQVCDVVENEEQADAYLEEASDAGHPVARRLVEKYGRLDTTARWTAIRTDLGLDGDPLPASDDTKFERRLENVGFGCQPNPPLVTAPETSAGETL
ncbi:peptidoglycan-binding protein [Aquisalinus flavus]|nr:peptidoglycan-binding protein [Aquisalinus flavus]MBD0425758.1 peptidoglycan-binding protein [Aquisalinus flavus]